MSAIRPLATIAVLSALGVFLALKINEQPPVALNDDALQPWAETAGAGDSTEAPAFDPSQMSLSPREAPAADAMGEAPAFSPAAPLAPAASEPLPELPPMPSLPAASASAAPVTDAPATSVADATPRNNATPPNDAPLDIATPPPASMPTARYGDTPTEPVEVSTPTAYGSVPPSGGAPAFETPSTAPSAPLSAATPPAAASPFDSAWPVIKAALDRDELTRAHLLLSQWRDEPTLTDSQRADVNVLLDDLAGSVVYSIDHRLEPPHTVRAGETLQTVADQYGVPWQLLGKINGVSRPDALTPGQTLKVVRGPFTAELSLANNELVLLLDGRYAGRFPVRVEGAAAGEGRWRVDRKASAPSPTVVLSGGGGTIVVDASPVASPEHQGRITVASRDARDVHDILSVGSTVRVIR